MVGYSRLLKAGLIRTLNAGGGESEAEAGAGRGRPKERGKLQVPRFITVHVAADRSRWSSRPAKPTKEKYAR